jgi:hypothetical protein
LLDSRTPTSHQNDDRNTEIQDSQAHKPFKAWPEKNSHIFHTLMVEVTASHRHAAVDDSVPCKGNEEARDAKIQRREIHSD